MQRLLSLQLTAAARVSFVLLAVASCGGNNHTTIDAATPVDTVSEDAASVALDCSSYCATIQSHCMDANAQYTDTPHCMAACASFTVGTSTTADTSGNTLGCRIHYAVDAVNAPSADCVAAGPAGDRITNTHPSLCSGGNICTSFCAIEIMACGSTQAPLPGDPTDGTNNPFYQYFDATTCVNQCAGLDFTHEYSPTARGDALACRLTQAIDAAISVNPNGFNDCADTGAPAHGLCDGTATP